MGQIELQSGFSLLSDVFDQSKRPDSTRFATQKKRLAAASGPQSPHSLRRSRTKAGPCRLGRHDSVEWRRSRDDLVGPSCIPTAFAPDVFDVSPPKDIKWDSPKRILVN